MARKAVNIFFSVLLVLLVAFVVMIFITRAMGNSPEIFGYRIFRVSSGSMEPELAIGDVILVQKVDPEDIHIDDIITYKGVQGDFADKMITHLVIEEPYEDDNGWHYQTQGIAAGALKDPIVSYDQVQGKLVKKLAFMNDIYTFFLSPWGLISFILVILVLFGYEMISLIISYKAIDEKGEDYYAPANKKPRKKRKK